MVGFLAALAACGGGTTSPKDASGGEAIAVDAPPAIVEPVHFYGRWDGMSAGWPGATIAARFSGTQLSATFDASGNDWIEITIDGVVRAPLHLAAGTHAVTVATGLAAGEHEIELAKRTESFFGKLRFDGFTGATIIPSARATRFVELIGDSITAGYGVLGAHPCSFDASTEAEPHAWGAFAARELGAARTSLAYSGVGMARNNDGSTTNTMPTRYGRTFADNATPAWTWSTTPDVVVIGLGTNDYASGDPGQAYEDAYVAFVRDQVRAHAPAAPVLLATSAMMGGTPRAQMRARLDAVVARLADPKVSVVEIPEQLASDGYGCDYHPNEISQHKMATALVPAIRAVTGW